MRSLFGLLVVALVFIVGGSFAYRRMRQVPLVAPALPVKNTDSTPNYPEAKEAAQAMKMSGHLAD